MKKRGLALVFVLAACSGGAPNRSPPGTVVTTTPDPSREAELASLQAKLDTVKDLDAAGFASKYGLTFSTELGYAPLQAISYDRVRASTFAPTVAEEAMLAKDGFVVTDRTRFATFVHGYQNIYSDHLPVFVSADSVLFAVHKSFDAILKSIERETLQPALTQLLGSMRSALGAGAANDLSAAARADVDVYLAVAVSLLSGSLASPVAGGDAAKVKSLFDKASGAQGHDEVTFFGTPRAVDFSQFAPRGHYADGPRLAQYFQASMWLGRIDLRILDTIAGGTQVFHRRELEGAYVMRAIMDANAIASWKKIDDLISGFFGEHDNMTVSQLDSLLADLRLATAADLATVSDAVIAQAIVSGNYGGQRVASQLMISGLQGGAVPLAHTFMLLGQRYTLDSHVFTNLVFDRVHSGVHRLMPNPLDVAFAALGNNQAGALLGDEIVKYTYASDLASMRILADEHPAEYWDANLYNEWMSLQRALSPTRDVSNPSAVGMPKVTGTEPWGRRVLSTQLASWAELRHDTILYAKQSFTFIDLCEYPDAYVEPYPEFFTRLAAFATRGAALTADLPSFNAFYGPYAAYFERLRSVAATLEAMARNQRTGAPHTAEQIAFINSLTFQSGCGSPTYDGWYAKLFYEPEDAVSVDSLVADVHTQPADEDGNDVGRVLHVGTWLPRTMIVTVESCSGPRAYVGLVSSYHETITQNYVRLSDEDWRQQNLVNGVYATPPEVPWMSPLLTH